jgi:dolichol-phosphate mannosyltransferase
MRATIDNNSPIALIIPTLNEAANIVQIINAYLSLPYNIHVLVADSASPDDTGKLVLDSFKDNSNVTLIDASAQRGRGASIVYTYKWIIDNNVPCIAIAASDADFSHDPKDFHKLFTALKDADVVIGSRYSPTSKIVGWPVKRRVFSYAANVLARTLLRVGITDYTNGYRIFRRPMLTGLDFASIDADGYIHLSQELLQWHRLKATIVEVPTTFVNRARGASNLKLKLIIESLAVIFKLAWQHRVQGKQISKKD